VWDESNLLEFSSGARSTWFAGQAGASYAFRLRALDANGQPELWPDGDDFETSVTFPDICRADTFEPDDEFSQARDLSLDQEAQRNLCGVGDPDWFQVEIEDPGDYLVITRSLYGGAAVKITVYADDGFTILANGQAPDVGHGGFVRFTATSAGNYYIKAEPLTSTLMGTEAIYGLRAAAANDIFLPLVMR
jgi:hypothetical protein